MVRRSIHSLVLLLVFITSFFPYQTVQALRGSPGSSEFGYGAILHPEGPDLAESLTLAADLGLDWMAVPFDWNGYQPDQAIPPTLEGLDPILETAAVRGISILLSITHCPQWAMTLDGPDPEETAILASLLASRYPSAVQAIELFPGANTSQGWGAAASPLAYSHVFQAASQKLHGENPAIMLVAAGLQPLPEILQEGDLQDLFYLQALYDLGAAGWMPVVSLHLPEITGKPMILSSSREGRVFRRYEDIRRVMAKNHHHSGLIWITQLSLPSGRIDVQDSDYQNADAQTAWLSQAYVMLRSQLYIGVAFLPSLNSGGEGTAAQGIGLVRGAGDYHPFYSVLRKLIGANQGGTLPDKPGKAKWGCLLKQRPWL